MDSRSVRAALVLLFLLSFLTLTVLLHVASPSSSMSLILPQIPCCPVGRGHGAMALARPPTQVSTSEPGLNPMENSEIADGILLLQPLFMDKDEKGKQMARELGETSKWRWLMWLCCTFVCVVIHKQRSHSFMPLTVD
uniref:Uncharacterized protein n=1 Tax=Fusarium oxysporum (strain Fo5176) TaxID=660025 RepID=A0A0C4DIL1_FUSOF